ncbi:MAG: hypothetical protein GXO30_01100 [Epsilonproteobacteria bacterium]|nr:hypothetical protein [Campylobacterota bacterium]
MKRLISGFLVFSAILLFSGCANKVATYAVSTNNVLSLQGMSKENGKINLGDFTDSDKNEAKVMCRLATPIGTPSGETFSSYIKDAFTKELLISGMYDPNSKVTISANLDDIYGSTTIANAYWEFKVTVKSSNGLSYKVHTKYEYESSYSAASACSEMQRSFVPAVQKLIGDIVQNPKFKDLIK